MEQNKSLTDAEAMQYSPLSLAFLGDSVYEQLVRQEIILRANMPPGKLHNAAVKLVRASYQAKAAHYLYENEMSEQEQYIYKRGRNSSSINVPKSAEISEYRAATGLETLFGYLFITGKSERYKKLYKILRENIKE
ncbi:MAG: ribonuclease III [Ruminococcus sp.]|nr:ribonuclease III [Ruminococcus sp.]